MNILSKAVIVAAGKSSRLYPLTKTTPKGLLDIGKESLLKRSIRILKENGIKEIAIVVGFERQKIQEQLAQEGITFIFNPFFAQTNNLGSLWFAKQWVNNEPFLYLHSDIIYDSTLVTEMIDSKLDSGALMLVDADSIDEEAMKVRISSDGLMVESNKEIPLNEANGEWIGMTRFSRNVIPDMFATLEEVLEENSFQAYDTEAFSRMANRNIPFYIEYTHEKPWVEIDFLSDLEKAKELFKP